MRRNRPTERKPSASTPQLAQLAKASDPRANAERFKVNVVQRAAVEAAIGMINAAQSSIARANAILGGVKAEVGAPQEAKVLGLDERGLVVDMHAGAPKP